VEPTVTVALTHWAADTEFEVDRKDELMVKTARLAAEGRVRLAVSRDVRAVEVEDNRTRASETSVLHVAPAAIVAVFAT